MSALPKPKLSVFEYLAIETRAEFKSEYFKGEMFAMAGASPTHNFIKENLSIELGVRLKGGLCRALSADQRIKIERTGLFTYPDLLIFCGVPAYDVDDPYSLLNPVAIIEVLSPSTEKYDRGAKFRNYQQISSLTEYILVAQDEPVCERFTRSNDGSWAFVSFVGLAAELVFTSVLVKIPLSDVYNGVSFVEIAPR